jgi:lysozyme family protein
MDLIDRVIAREGGSKVSRDPNDPGGVTKFGISKRAYPDEDIENLTEERARQLYEQRMMRSNIDKIQDPYLREHVFDFHVHSDPWDGTNAVSVRNLQRLLGVTVDGVIGPETIQAVNSRVWPFGFYMAYIRDRILYWVRVIQKRPTSLKYLTGWVNRVFNI